METIRVSQRTTADGVLSLRIPLGKPDAEYDVVVVVQPKQNLAMNGWPAGYFDLAGSIDDEPFCRQPQGEFPTPASFD